MPLDAEDVKKYAAIAGGVILLLGAFTAALTLGGPSAPRRQTVSAEATPAAGIASGAESAAHDDDKEETSVTVYVTGEVARPGVYKLAAGSRVNDAVARAGGLSAQADPEAVNLAEKLSDGVQIYIPNQSARRLAAEQAAREKREARTLQAAPKAELRPAPRTEPQRSGSAIVAGGGSKTKKININKADEDELVKLPGIGPGLARAIAEHRAKNGPFRSAEEIKNVRGIGDAKYEAIKEMISVSGR